MHEHGIESLSAVEREDYRIVELHSRKLAANPAWQELGKEVARQAVVYERARPILARLPLRERARYDDWTPAAFLLAHEARPPIAWKASARAGSASSAHGCKGFKPRRPRLRRTTLRREP